MGSKETECPKCGHEFDPPEANPICGNEGECPSCHHPYMWDMIVVEGGEDIRFVVFEGYEGYVSKVRYV